MKKKLVTLMLTVAMVSSVGATACAYYGDGSDGYVTATSGDTYWDIANAFGWNTDDLLAVNGSDGSIYVGDTVYVGEPIYETYEEPYDGYTYVVTDNYTYDDSNIEFAWQEESSCSGDFLGGAYLGVYSGGNSGYNIELACANCNGVVIPSGGCFSAFDTIGAGSQSEGYLESTVYYGDEVTTAYGGGICAVTTGIFQASRNAGLTIIEGGADHSLDCAYAESGDQSMFAYPTNNLVVYNPYDYPIVLYTSYNGQLNAEWYAY